MPIVEQSDINWAREIDEKDTEIEFNEDSGLKRVIEYKTEDDKKFKITNIFRIERVRVPRSIAERKELRKFGDAAGDPPGVNSATTVVSDEVFLQFLSNKDDSDKQEAVPTPIPLVKCRVCRGDHWTAKCPHKDLFQDRVMDSRVEPSRVTADSTSGAYKPPSMRNGAAAAQMPSSSTRGGKFDSGRGGAFNKDEYTVRVTNLPEEATEADLQELFKPFGKVNRIFLAKDKNTQASRGFAFVNFQNKDDAQRAIWGVNDYGYNHLILKVEWAK